jgi:hypothetical protein
MIEQPSNYYQKRTIIILPGYFSNRVDIITDILKKRGFYVKCFDSIKEATGFCCKQLNSIECIITAMNINLEELRKPEINTVGGLFTGHALIWEVISPIIADQKDTNLPKILMLTEKEYLSNIDVLTTLINGQQKALFTRHVYYVPYDEANIEQKLKDYLGG